MFLPLVGTEAGEIEHIDLPLYRSFVISTTGSISFLFQMNPSCARFPIQSLLILAAEYHLMRGSYSPRKTNVSINPCKPEQKDEVQPIPALFVALPFHVIMALNSLDLIHSRAA